VVLTTVLSDTSVLREAAGSVSVTLLRHKVREDCGKKAPAMTATTLTDTHNSVETLLW